MSPITTTTTNSSSPGDWSTTTTTKERVIPGDLEKTADQHHHSPADWGGGGGGGGADGCSKSCVFKSTCLPFPHPPDGIHIYIYEPINWWRVPRKWYRSRGDQQHSIRYALIDSAWLTDCLPTCAPGRRCVLLLLQLLACSMCGFRLFWKLDFWLCEKPHKFRRYTYRYVYTYIVEINIYIWYIAL